MKASGDTLCAVAYHNLVNGDIISAGWNCNTIIIKGAYTHIESWKWNNYKLYI